MNKERIGISLATLLPWSAFPCIEPLAKILALPIAEAMTKQIGASFWQVLPLKGVTAKGLKRTGIPVRYAERLGATTIWRWLLRGEGNWLEVALFPKPDSCEQIFQEILRMPTIGIDHDLAGLNKGLLVELFPGLEKEPAELAQVAAKIGRKPYVIDTRHLRRLEGSWRKALEILMPYTALIHVQPENREELLRLLKGSITEVEQILMYIWRRYEGPFVIEIHPAILGISSSYFWWPPQGIKVLRRFREIIETYA